ncbi:autophagy-related protein 9A-like [Tropilaelaps mercedesae]|uniref:Autophagy-related protein 9 n=1 Tax=Tropilaelaps mercedesae TaxID=418985 RepID=A0A1V9X293_9ACAR|nr:autophagy-related protein 9A-like [Tropilaelaps mercedesae]
MCVMIQNMFEVLQLVFLIVFITFLSSCVDYAILFRDKPVGGHNKREHVKVKLKDGIIPPGQCIAGLSGTIRFCLVIALFFLFYKIFMAMKDLCSFLEIKRFYRNVLNIEPGDLENITWHDVQLRLLDSQRNHIHPIAVHKAELNELDVYHQVCH